MKIIKVKNLWRSILLVSLFFASCNKQAAEDNKGDQEQVNYTSYVNPFIGTAPLTDPKAIGYTPPKDWRVWAGLTYPGSSLPNAMVQLSPITKYGSGAGYEYEDTEIIGFTHTNKGHWNLCNIPILPVAANATYPFKSSFSHKKENASPAYYEVFLEDYKVDVKLSSTLRSGIHQYTFENNQGRKLLFDLGRSNNHVDNWEINLVGKNGVSGFQQMGREKIYFYAEVSQQTSGIEKKNEGASNGYALISVSDDGNPVVLKIGLSFVSIANAKENLTQEIGNKTLEEIKQSGNVVWETLLSKIEVSGGSKKEKEMFYTSFYRSFLWPALRSDINGEFTDDAGKTQQKDFQYYTIPSLWDTYRNKVVLLDLFSPKVSNDIISSLIDRGEIRDFIPTFFHGDHAASYITGAYKRGLNNFDVEKAYQLLLNNAYKEGGTRPFITEYIEKGYISDPKVENAHVETKAKAGVSKTLEYAYDDYSLAQLAKEMNDEAHYKDLLARSKNYKNVFDTATNFMRGRLENGDWITPFDPQYPYYEYMYREANAWQVSFYTPHDMQGLVALYGGAAPFEAKLDSLFTTPWNPEHIARNVSSFMGQYCQGNQPGHEAPFSYYFVDKPYKSQKVIDALLKDYYGTGEHGLALPGMDDAGEMSSWYVFSAMGLYPFSPSDAEYLVSIPLFDEVSIKTSTNKLLKIKANSAKRKLKAINVNTKKIDGYFISHSLFVEGGSLELETE